MKPSDVLVAGNGMAGFVAALAAALRGKNVRIAARGSGGLAISGGCVDLLGYVGDTIVTGDPVQAVADLPLGHPYRLVGAEGVREAIAFFTETCARHGLDLRNEGGANHWVPTILGTFKPTYLCPPRSDRDTLAGADRILIPILPWLKDCHAGMAHSVLLKQRRLRDKIFATPLLSPPHGPTHRNLTPLDMARFVDTPDGEAWLQRELTPHATRDAGRKTAVLLPPILGISRSTAIRSGLEDALGCPVLEMLSPPPGVGGLRIREALKSALSKAGVLMMENADIVDARTEGGRCLYLVTDAPDKRRHLEADSFIIATGGFFGGAAVASPGAARDAVFDIDLGAPESVEAWSVPEIFESQPYARLGVRVNERMNPVAPDGSVLWENVFFAGRALAGYDFVLEKCGHGVAIATGYHAARFC